ncbi:MAG: hypothetical protein K6G75_02660 [Lachnospiraceae bacterium]|nr:hypothetical protein [Lachnospiraceae bacterium]
MKLIADIVLNLTVVLNMILFTIMSFKRDGEWNIKNIKRALKFFTYLSNVLLAVSSLLIIVFPNSFIAWMIKYTGTAAVSVTMVTVLVFLGPTIGYKKVLAGRELWMHLLNPLIAIITFAILERRSLSFLNSLFGMIPVILYGTMYYYKVLVAKEEKRWDDFYGFNKGGKWYLAIFFMLAGTFAICMAFYFTGRIGFIVI